MSTRVGILLIVVASGTLAACAAPGVRQTQFSAPEYSPPSPVTRSGRLYPDVARAVGVLTASFIDNGSGHGAVAIGSPGAETFAGEYTIVVGGVLNFGSTYGLVFEQLNGGMYAGQEASRSMPGASQGTASAFGSSGTSLDCEFYNDNVSGHGYGACKTSTGALYRLQY